MDLCRCSCRGGNTEMRCSTGLDQLALAHTSRGRGFSTVANKTLDMEARKPRWRVGIKRVVGRVGRVNKPHGRRWTHCQGHIWLCRCRQSVDFVVAGPRGGSRGVRRGQWLVGIDTPCSPFDAARALGRLKIASVLCLGTCIARSPQGGTHVGDGEAVQVLSRRLDCRRTKLN